MAALKDANVAEGLPYFRQHLGERPRLLNPHAEWDAKQSRLLVTIETEGDDPTLESEGVFDEVWDCVIAAFDASETVSFNIRGAEAA